VDDDVTPLETGTSELLARLDGAVAVLTLNRPEARNALSDNLTPALREMLRRIRDDPSVRAVLITGAGSAFCAGGDVKGMGGGGRRADASRSARRPLRPRSTSFPSRPSPHYRGPLRELVCRSRWPATCGSRLGLRS
jgi:hypothetical protein